MQASVSSERPLTPAPAASDGGDAALVRSVGGFVKYLMHTYGRAFYDAVDELELSFSQIRALHILCLSLDEASLKRLADELHLSLPAASRSIDGLVRRGLVTRVENTSDRRLKSVRATDAARELVDRMIELRVAGLEGFVRSLSASERSNLAAALAPIVAREDIAPLCLGRHRSPIDVEKGRL